MLVGKFSNACLCFCFGAHHQWIAWQKHSIVSSSHQRHLAHTLETMASLILVVRSRAARHRESVFLSALRAWRLKLKSTDCRGLGGISQTKHLTSLQARLQINYM